MSNVLVTIIIPVYNVEKYLEECLDSLVNQEYKNLEIIAIDDGSTDKSLEILNSYQNSFENYKIITQENKGQGAARNAGIEHITGKYTYFLDADDYILPETIVSLVELAEENELDLIRFNGRSFVEEGFDYPKGRERYGSGDLFTPRSLYDNKSFILANFEGFLPSPCLYFTKSSVIKENNLRFKDIKHEDRLFIVTLFKDCHRIMYDPMEYFQRRYRPNSTLTSNIMSNIKSFDSRIVIIHESERIMRTEVPEYYAQFLRKNSEMNYRQMFEYQIDDKEYKKSKIKMLRKTYGFKNELWINFKKLVKRILKR